MYIIIVAVTSDRTPKISIFNQSPPALSINLLSYEKFSHKIRLIAIQWLKFFNVKTSGSNCFEVDPQ